MNSNNPKRLQSFTMDAWLLLYVAFGFYVVFQLLVSKLSILGATAAGQALCLLVPSLLYAKWKSGSVVEGLRLHPVAGGITWRVALLALTFIGVGDLLQQAAQPVITRYFADLIPALEAMMEILTPKSTAALAGNLVVVGLLAPVCEEALFRGAFQGTLEQRGPVRAILTSALMFSFVHLNPFDFLGIVMSGIALGFVTWRTQSLWPAILWHVLNNSAATLAFYFGGKSFSMPIWLSAVLTVAFGGLAWEFVRHMRHAAPAKPGALATAPALLGRKASRVAMAGGLTALLSLVAGAVCFGRVRLGSDFLAPDYTRGDIAIYTRGPAFRPAKLQPGDVVMYRRTTSGLIFTRILAMDGEKVTVIGPKNDSGGQLEDVVSRKDIIGRVVWKFDPGESLKGLVEQVESKGANTPENPKK